MDVLTRRILLAAILLLGGPMVRPAVGAVPREYQLKAAFLYNFTAFVGWPPEAFYTHPETFVIGILGQDPFGSLLDELLEGELAEGRRVTVRRLRHAGEVGQCHVVFVAASEGWRLSEILRRCAGQPVLTVSDLPGFADAGGMIGFTFRDNRIALEVNPVAADNARLTISSKLLRVARLSRPVPRHR